MIGQKTFFLSYHSPQNDFWWSTVKLLTYAKLCIIYRSRAFSKLFLEKAPAPFGAFVSVKLAYWKKVSHRNYALIHSKHCERTCLLTKICTFIYLFLELSCLALFIFVEPLFLNVM